MSDATVSCPACGDTHAAPNGDPLFLQKNVSRCDVCDAHIVYGEIAPKVVVAPDEFATVDGPKPAMLVRFQDRITGEDHHSVKLDPRHAFLVAQSIISLVRP
jgi:hypothetical protein